MGRRGMMGEKDSEKNHIDRTLQFTLRLIILALFLQPL
jgi:hypothetical protein